jgi:2-keto-4-pentenoate hydratase/2-oxohepta-3-ene-1,7-dioic acid hydratase in catechol pathway
MQLCTVRTEHGETAAVLVPGYGPVPTADLLGRPTGDLLDHVVHDELDELRRAADSWKGAEPSTAVPEFLVPFRRPGKVLGIGLNYSAHAGDLGAQAPRSSPASFFKASHTIIGPDEDIVLPAGVGRVTAEAEMGLVFGRECYKVSESDAMSYVAGICAVLDQTAEEVLLENPRYLTRTKNYPTFFSFGPVIVTMDEVLAAVGDLQDLTVRTIHNGRVHKQDEVRQMIFSPAELVSFHSHVMPFQPGDILSTGTPGAVPIEIGDSVSCELGDLTRLNNSVVG